MLIPQELQLSRCGYYEEFDIFAPAIKKMKKHDNV